MKNLQRKKITGETHNKHIHTHTQYYQQQQQLVNVCQLSSVGIRICDCFKLLCSELKAMRQQQDKRVETKLWRKNNTHTHTNVCCYVGFMD